MHALEKQHLKKVSGTYIFENILIPSITRTIHKDNVIRFDGNRYSVPKGTFRKDAPNIAYVYTENGYLYIRLKQTGAAIAKHKISSEKGLVISDPTHRERNTSKRNLLINEIQEVFHDKDSIQWLIEQLQERYPRHLVDQLKVIQSSIKKYPNYTEQTLEKMIKLKMTSANDFRDIAHSLSVQSQNKICKVAIPNEKYKDIKAPERTEDIHLKVLSGGNN